MGEEKFSDLLMEHAVKYQAFKAAKKYAKLGEKGQMDKVMHFAKVGGRAGAVKPLHKAARTLAVQAVKKARRAIKAAKKKVPHKKMRKVCMQAAKKAVNKLLADKDVDKYPPRIIRARDDDKPNHFTAPPSVHLLLGGGPPAKKAKKAKKAPAAKKAPPAKKAPAHAKKAPAHAKKTHAHFKKAQVATKQAIAKVAHAKAH